MTDELSSHQPPARVSRRGLLLGAAAAGGLAVGGGSVGAAAAAGAFTSPSPAAKTSPLDVVNLDNAYPFYGKGPQAGIASPPQRYTVYMTFDMSAPLASQLQVLLARWSGAIAQMMAGQPVGQVEPAGAEQVGADTGEAFGLAPSSLTVTVGLGPSLFTDAYGLTAQKPALLRDLRQLPSDALNPAISGGDLSLQACADDPQVAYHAIRNLARIASDSGAAGTRWTVLGFGRASAGTGQATPRNLLGFKDGTRNLKTAAELDKFVWAKDGPQWQRGGTYQVVRKIQMDIENWDSDRVSDQNEVFGRHKQSGAPLTGKTEFDTPNFTATAASGTTVISPHAHIALAAFENNGGLRILRRSYNYTDGINQIGVLDAGLLFVSYQNDPAHFEALQTKLGASDGLNEYITHIGSAVFFVPPAPVAGSYIGEAMFT